MPAMAGAGTRADAGRQELNPGPPRGWQDSNELSHPFYLPQSVLAGGLSQEPELGVEPRYFQVGPRHLNQS